MEAIVRGEIVCELPRRVPSTSEATNTMGDVYGWEAEEKGDGAADEIDDDLRRSVGRIEDGRCASLAVDLTTCTCKFVRATARKEEFAIITVKKMVIDMYPCIRFKKKRKRSSKRLDQGVCRQVT